MSFKLISLIIYGNNGYLLTGNQSKLPVWNTSEDDGKKEGVISTIDNDKEVYILFLIKNIKFAVIIKIEERQINLVDLGVKVYNNILLNREQVKNNLMEKLQYIPLTGVLHPLPQQKIIPTLYGDIPINIWNNVKNKNSENELNILKKFIEILNKKIVLDISSNEKSV